MLQSMGLQTVRHDLVTKKLPYTHSKVLSKNPIHSKTHCIRSINVVVLASGKRKSWREIKYHLLRIYYQAQC